MADAVLKSLAVPISLSTDQWSAGLQRIQRDAKSLENDLKPLADPLKSAGVEAKKTGESMSNSFRNASTAAKDQVRWLNEVEEATKRLDAKFDAADRSVRAFVRSTDEFSTLGDPLSEFGDDFSQLGAAVESSTAKITHSFGDAHAAASGLEQMLGVHLPRSVTRFLAESESIGPILAGAFSAVAVIGMIQVLEQLPAIYKKLESAVTGWDDTAKKAYDHQLELNRQLVEILRDAEAAYIKLDEAAGRISGVESTKRQIDLLETEKARQLDIINGIQEEINARTKLEETSKALGGVAALGAMAANILTSRVSMSELTEQMKVAQGEVDKLEKAMQKLGAADMAAAKARDEAKARREVSGLLSEINSQQETARKGAEKYAEALAKAADAAARLTNFLRGAEGVFEAPIARFADLSRVLLALGPKVTAIQGALGTTLDPLLTDAEVLANALKGIQAMKDKDAADAAALAAARAKGDAERLAAAKQFQAQGQAVIDHFIDDISRMFTSMIAHGQSFWEAFKNLGKSAVAAIADTFLSIMLHSFLDPFAKQFGEWLSNMKDRLSSLMKGVDKEGNPLKGFFGGLNKEGAPLTGLKGTASKVATTAVQHLPEIGAAVAGFVVLNKLIGNFAREHKALTIALTGGVGAVIVLLNGLHKLANEFVQKIQNPFAKSVDSLFESLSEAQQMGSLTADQVKQSRFSLEKMWKDFQAEAAKANSTIGAQALATMTPFMKTWREWLDGLDKAAIELERMAKVQEFMAKVGDAAKDSEALNEAISNLRAAGVDASVIVKFLGGDVLTMVDAMMALHQEIPDATKAIYGLAKATGFMSRVTDAAQDSEALNNAIATLQGAGVEASAIVKFLGGDILSMVDSMKALHMEIPAGIAGIYDLIRAIERIGEIDNELESVFEQLSSAIIQKLDILDAGIAEATKNIEDWSRELDDLTKTLDDAAHWQKVYDDAVRESAANYEKLTNERVSIEKRIQDITQDIEREKLVEAVKNAKAVGAVTETLVKTFAGITKGGHAFTAVATTIGELGGNASAVTKAQKELDDFDAAIRAQQQAARLTELETLKTRLPEVIGLQRQASEAWANASVTAQESIEKQKEETRARIAWLKGAIGATKAHLVELNNDKEATEALAKALGISRRSEWEKINDTILSLEGRVGKLIEEREQLELLFPAAKDANESIKDLIATLKSALMTPAEIKPPEIKLPEVAAVPPTPELPTIPAATSFPGGYEGGTGDIFGGMFWNGIPKFQMGTDYVPYTGLFHLEKGEAVTPADQKGSQVEALLRRLISAVEAGHTITIDGTKIGRAQNRAAQSGGSRLLATEVRR